MPIIIRLTTKSGSTIHVNASMIKRFYAIDERTEVHFVDGGYYEVMEKPHEIERLIVKALGYAMEE